ncbi:nucleotide-excision repair, DNA incision, 3'-to lesion [Marasmius crinis-equi]|uniref:Nucleotide-excision repair, DNA incision, 3'-to lesion n=1 Tax=Marasmius crinis-equi TaxID=585013 RepID=A0ABR3FJR7_9AGAR
MPDLYRDTSELITQFGYYPVVTEREADCHLASLSQSGIINGVISEDSDLLGLGVNKVLRKSRSAKELIYDVYSLDEIRKQTGLGQEGIILVALLTGDDTQDGLESCGIETAVQTGSVEASKRSD